MAKTNKTIIGGKKNKENKNYRERKNNCKSFRYN